MTHHLHADIPTNLFALPLEERLGFITDMMREMSEQTEPQAMVKAYSQRIRKLWPSDGFVSLSRRDLDAPRYRVTRSSVWERAGRVLNPWSQKNQLPIFEGGVLGDLIYGEEPVALNDFVPSPDDPAYEHLAGYRSLAAVPLYDGGKSINMVVVFKREPRGFRRDELPERVLISNLFGRATQTLVLHEEVRRAYDQVDRELRAVADIQRSLLPAELPAIPSLETAAHYQTSRRAGGDYYDFFPLPNGQWGILIADVSGHGTPAAVLMAITHSIAHTCSDPKCPPSRLLAYVNRQLAGAYTGQSGHFVTAFYGIYDPPSRLLTYSNAGHPAPRVRRCGTGETRPTAEGVSLPLGIDADEQYSDGSVVFAPGDVMVLYTDGITEARSAADPADLFGTARLDDVLRRCGPRAAGVVADVLAAVEAFSDGAPPSDDRTLLVLKAS
jgi:sigma-B regulation protein RsbU (phosphoserine phosphatase)